MTRDEFDGKYRILKQIEGGDGRSYTAEHRATGRAVMVHFVPASAPGASALLGLISRLSPQDRAKISDTLAVGDSTVVVSEFVDVAGSFERWLEGRSRPSVNAAASVSDVIPAARISPDAGGGDFTHLFRQGSPSAGAENAPPLNPLQAAQPNRPQPDALVAGQTPPDPPAGPRPGGFTDLFRAPQDPGAASPGSIAPSATGPAVPLRSLRLPTPPQMRPAPPVTPPSPPPPLRAEPTDRPPLLAPRALDVPRLGGAAVPGFVLPTMTGPVGGTEAVSPPVMRQGPSDYTRILSGLPSTMDPGAFRDLPASVGPGGSGAASTGGTGGPDPLAAEPRSYLPLWIALNVALIVALGLVLYFALR
jgi:hypothetical protein